MQKKKSHEIMALLAYLLFHAEFSPCGCARVSARVHVCRGKTEVVPTVCPRLPLLPRECLPQAFLWT